MSINLDFILLEQFSIYSILESARCTGAKKDNVVHRRILVKCNENTTKNMDYTIFKTLLLRSVEVCPGLSRSVQVP